MFKNYLKLAVKVLGRRKFFTFISLFGISFTLMVLMVIMAFMDTELGANAPMSKADRMVLVDRFEMKKQYYDTIYSIDSNLVGEVMIYDTTDVKTEPGGKSMSSSNPSHFIFTEHLSDVQPVERKTILLERPFDSYKEGRKYNLQGIYTDAEYWNILDFNFQAGTPINAEQVSSAASVAVVTDRFATEFFGSSANVLGKVVPISGRQFEVIGVVSRTRSSSEYTRADIYIPYTTADPREFEINQMMGGWRGIYLAPDEASVAALKDALDYTGRNIQLPPNVAKDYDQVRVYAYDMEEKYAWFVFRDEKVSNSLFYFRLALFSILGFFILIPTLNLINLNLSRMMERAPEIGVRKSFGANSTQVLVQFLFENVIVTLIGGAIGFVLALLVIYLINQSGALPDSVLAFNWRVFGLSFLLCLVFGVLSGMLPAWRMSRMHIVKGLHS